MFISIEIHAKGGAYPTDMPDKALEPTVNSFPSSSTDGLQLPPDDTSADCMRSLVLVIESRFNAGSTSETKGGIS